MGQASGAGATSVRGSAWSLAKSPLAIEVSWAASRSSGNSCLQSLLIQAAKFMLLWPAKWRQHSFENWLAAASTRLRHNVLAAALANKLARIAWSVLRQNYIYEP
jgi:hypothetical protein